ncbi:MAG: hypothetical protein MI757_23155 [Pirellulales bacterium]|nr:hypothetical protein [Pirellulales bacterium]
MRRFQGGLLLAVVCAIAIGCSSKDGDGKDGDAKKAFDASYIPADAAAVIVLHPSALLKSELLEGAPLDEMLEDTKRQMGIELPNIEQLVMAFAPKPDEEPEPLVVIRTDKPVDKEKVGGRQFQGERGKEMEYEGKKYKQSMRPSFGIATEAGEEEVEEMKPGKMAMYMPDDTTVVVGPTENVKAIIKTPEADSALIKRLKNIEMHDVVVLAEVGEARGLLKDASQGLTGAPKGELAQWAADHVERIELWADVSPKVAINVTVDTDDAEGGKKLATEVEELRTQAEGLLMLAKGQLSSMLPKELAEKTAKLGTDAVAAIKGEDKGKSYVLTFTEPDGTRAVVKELMVEAKKMQEKQKAEFEKWEKEQAERAKEFEERLKKEEEAFKDGPAEESTRDSGDFDEGPIEKRTEGPGDFKEPAGAEAGPADAEPAEAKK